MRHPVLAWGQVAALYFPSPPLWIPSFAEVTVLSVKHSRLAGGFCRAQARPQRGTSPRATFSRSALGRQSTVRQALPVESGHQVRLEGTLRATYEMEEPALLPWVTPLGRCAVYGWRSHWSSKRSRGCQPSSFLALSLGNLPCGMSPFM